MKPELGMPRILRTRDAARYLGLRATTLNRWRTVRGTPDGPVFVRLGGRAIGYDMIDLDKWIDEQRRATIRRRAMESIRRRA